MSSPVSSTPVLRTTLLWSAVVTGVLAVVGAIVGFLVAGWPGLWSALVAIVLAAVFLAVTGASILVANRWFGDALYVPIFFAVVLGGWMVKFVLFLVALFVLRGQPWLHPGVFLIALIVSVLAALIIDVVVLTRMRIPHASDVTLPTMADVEAEEETRPDAGDGTTPQD